MNQKNITKANTYVILKSIVSDNKKLHTKIRESMPDLSEIQVYTALLLKLEYSSNEIRILLGISESSIVRISALLRNTQNRNF